MSSAKEETITIIVREDDFDVKCSSGVSLEDLYIVAVSLAQQLEDFADDSSCISGSTMLQ